MFKKFLVISLLSLSNNAFCIFDVKIVNVGQMPLRIKITYTGDPKKYIKNDHRVTQFNAAGKKTAYLPAETEPIKIAPNFSILLNDAQNYKLEVPYMTGWYEIPELTKIKKVERDWGKYKEKIPVTIAIEPTSTGYNYYPSHLTPKESVLTPEDWEMLKLEKE